MSAKTERIEVRADEASKSRIAEAAEMLGEPVSAFMVRSARAEADKVLARAERTIMPAGQFDLLIAALDEPDEAPVLTEIANRPRRFRRV
ncbi:DUF1778 domain-containing protein [Micromonospora sp. RL09-050-HVF-A]|uniref:type II toxin-antitoxin system TacA family antitoxin n=1 Tax=Micromonospora sp. RL09-050-HVF-A TaxID=1703433 RepID=UPI001C6022BC|nr:DUF1778 domain-containing protein [Micromonospora sp. RL09-050-HVF-A]MBW4703573.1 DUF1778 domain-containing protein [Micromonospora sp. RL09-050-HVF-A]